MSTLTLLPAWMKRVEISIFVTLVWIHHTFCQEFSPYDYQEGGKKDPHGKDSTKDGSETDQYPQYPWGTDVKYPDTYNYPGYDWSETDNYYGGGIGFYDETLEEYNNNKPKVMECYTCHYSKHKYNEQGMPNCDEPFNDDGVPTITCEGLCAKTRTVLDEGEYMLIRSCLPNCKDIHDPVTSVECCYGERCNGAIAGAAELMASRTVCVIAVTLCVLLQAVL